MAKKTKSKKSPAEQGTPYMEIYHILKTSEGGWGQKFTMHIIEEELKLKAKKAYSQFMGHTAVDVTCGKRMHKKVHDLLY